MKKGNHYRLLNCSNNNPVNIRAYFRQETIKKAPQLRLGALHNCGDST